MSFTGRIINLEAQNLVGRMNCGILKNNSLWSKGAWSGTRELLFKFWNHLCNFWMGEARHFYFFVRRVLWESFIEWWMTPKGASSGSRDLLILFWNLIRNFWTDKSIGLDTTLFFDRPFRILYNGQWMMNDSQRIRDHGHVIIIKYIIIKQRI